MTARELVKMLCLIDGDAEVTVLGRPIVRVAVDTLRILVPGSVGQRDKAVDLQLPPAYYGPERPDHSRPKIEGLDFEKKA